MSAISDAADEAVSTVTDAYDQLVGDTEPHWYSTQSDAQKQVWGDVQALKPQIDAWKGTYRRWAEQGQRDDGTPFSWSMWANLGKTYGDSIRAFGSYYVDASAFQAVLDAALQTAVDVGNAASNAAQSIGHLVLSPWVWWVGGGVLVLALVGPILVPLLRRANT